MVAFIAIGLCFSLSVSPVIASSRLSAPRTAGKGISPPSFRVTRRSAHVIAPFLSGLASRCYAPATRRNMFEAYAEDKDHSWLERPEGDHLADEFMQSALDKAASEGRLEFLRENYQGPSDLSKYGKNDGGKSTVSKDMAKLSDALSKIKFKKKEEDKKKDTGEESAEKSVDSKDEEGSDEAK